MNQARRSNLRSLDRYVDPFLRKGENNPALDHRQSTKFSIDFNPHPKSGDLTSGSLVFVGTTEYQETKLYVLRVRLVHCVDYGKLDYWLDFRCSTK